MLQQVETSVEDPITTDNTVMTRAEKRFSAQAYCVLVLTTCKHQVPAAPCHDEESARRGLLCHLFNLLLDARLSFKDAALGIHLECLRCVLNGGDRIGNSSVLCHGIVCEMG